MSIRKVFAPSQKVPLLLWPERIDRDALQQLQTLARCERLAGPVAVMPDVHSAGEVCVGTVLATADTVLPTAIGEDIGCGMAVEQLPLQASCLSHEQLERIVARIQDCVPTGKRSHSQAQELPATLRGPLSTRALMHHRDGIGARHIGTLGGGNHFIELQRDGADHLWVTVHTGSRGIGAAVAAHHAQLAKLQSGIRTLPFLRVGTGEFDAFWCDLEWALLFAVENRLRIHDRVRAVLAEFCAQRLAATDRFDVAHNVIRREQHGGRELLIHRKGAMPAPVGGRGIVPGSMGTASYIVEGLGCELSYATCSHGAGRRMSRHEAHRKISVAQLRREMGGVVYSSDARLERNLVEEAPSAYKPLKTVLAEQADLIRPVLRLEPLAVVKGG